MRSRPSYLTGATALFLLAACSGDTAKQVSGPPPLSGTAVTLTRFRPDPIAFTQLSGFDTLQTTVIRTDSAWAEAWSRLNTNLGSEPPRPGVDFTREVVVLAALGNRRTGGYDILLQSATEAGGGITVEVLQTSPGPGCIVTQALTQPVDIARLARVDLPVTFAITPRARHCAT